jgi:hypothetical protein
MAFIGLVVFLCGENYRSGRGIGIGIGGRSSPNCNGPSQYARKKSITSDEGCMKPSPVGIGPAASTEQALTMGATFAFALVKISSSILGMIGAVQSLSNRGSIANIAPTLASPFKTRDTTRRVTSPYFPG